MTTASVGIAFEGDFAVARIDGEVDLSNVRVVHRQLLGAAFGSAAGLVIDLSAARYLDSAAVGMLFDLARQLGDRRRGMGVVATKSSPLHRLLHITDLATLAPVRESLEECLAAIRDR